MGVVLLLLPSPPSPSPSFPILLPPPPSPPLPYHHCPSPPTPVPPPPPPFLPNPHHLVGLLGRSNIQVYQEVMLCYWVSSFQHSSGL